MHPKRGAGARVRRMMALRLAPCAGEVKVGRSRVVLRCNFLLIGMGAYAAGATLL